MRIWASANNVPHIAARDSRLEEGAALQDTTKGQHGWQWGIEFSTFRELVLTLTGSKVRPPANVCSNVWQDCAPPKPGDVRQLAVTAHGAAGKVDVDSNAAKSELGAPSLEDVQCLSVDSIDSYLYELTLLKLALHPNAMLFFMSCNAGFGVEGTDFLMAMSSVLPGRTILAYACYGWCDLELQHRRGSRDLEGACEPGMRELGTDWWGVLSKKQFAHNNWNDLQRLPWARAYSPYCKAVQDGRIVHGASL